MILLEGWILPIGGVALGRVCACSLRSRHVFSCSYFLLLVGLFAKETPNLSDSVPGDIVQRVFYFVCLFSPKCKLLWPEIRFAPQSCLGKTSFLPRLGSSASGFTVFEVCQLESNLWKTSGAAPRSPG